ncbi:MAG: hypothetical protein AAGK04_05675 [Planctomycetota bacterium]
MLSKSPGPLMVFVALVLAAAVPNPGARAQSILFASNGVLLGPSDPLVANNGDTFEIDVVLDATDYAGDFFAWHAFSFHVQTLGHRGAPSAVSATDISGNLDESDILATADTTGQPAIGNPWTGGRRPGAFPGSADINGGSRSGPDLGNIFENARLTGPNGIISGRQQAAAAPEGNALINQSRRYEVYRFQYTYNGGGPVGIALTDIEMSLYPFADSTESVTVTPTFVGMWATLGFIVPSAPTVAPLAVFAFVAPRRRR